MKNFIFIFMASLLPFQWAHSQNIPQCDSLQIECCTFTSSAQDTLLLNAGNTTTVLFDYPGFCLLSLNMDTIAKEQVNYFGIGSFPQPHYMTVIGSLSLPFNGYLALFTGFYDSLACIFPVSINSTSTETYQSSEFNIYPNPGNEWLVISPLLQANGNLLITDVLGKAVFEGLIYSNTDKLWVHTGAWPDGMYFITMGDLQGKRYSYKWCKSSY